MYHLLPPEEKKNVRRQYRARRIAVILAFAAVALSALFLCLLPSLFLARARAVSAEADLLAESSKNDPAAEKTLEAEIAAVKKKVALLAPASGPTAFDAIETAVLAKPSDIRLTGFFFAAEDPGRIRLTGIASTRESLVKFQNLLRAERIFSAVDLPISSFASSRNISFTILASGAF